MALEFRKHFFVRFGQVDRAGIVYYPTLYDTFHTAFEEFWREAAGRPYDRVLEDEGVGYPAVHVETDFRAPLRYGDGYEVAVTVARLGERSVTWHYRGFREGAGEPFLDARITTACVDMGTWRSRAVPADHRRLLEPYLDRD